MNSPTATAIQPKVGQTTASSSKAVPLIFAGLMGLSIVGFVGFVQIDAVHNAGHDYRHSMAFPCH